MDSHVAERRGRISGGHAPDDLAGLDIQTEDLTVLGTDQELPLEGQRTIGDAVLQLSCPDPFQRGQVIADDRAVGQGENHRFAIDDGIIHEVVCQSCGAEDLEFRNGEHVESIVLAGSDEPFTPELRRPEKLVLGLVRLDELASVKIDEVDETGEIAGRGPASVRRHGRRGENGRTEARTPPRPSRLPRDHGEHTRDVSNDDLLLEVEGSGGQVSQMTDPTSPVDLLRRWIYRIEEPVARDEDDIGVVVLHWAMHGSRQMELREGPQFHLEVRVPALPEPDVALGGLAARAAEVYLQLRSLRTVEHVGRVTQRFSIDDDLAAGRRRADHQRYLQLVDPGPLLVVRENLLQLVEGEAVLAALLVLFDRFQAIGEFHLLEANQPLLLRLDLDPPGLELFDSNGLESVEPLNGGFGSGALRGPCVVLDELAVGGQRSLVVPRGRRQRDLLHALGMAHELSRLQFVHERNQHEEKADDDRDPDDGSLALLSLLALLQANSELRDLVVDLFSFRIEVQDMAENADPFSDELLAFQKLQTVFEEGHAALNVPGFLEQFGRSVPAAHVPGEDIADLQQDLGGLGFRSSGQQFFAELVAAGLDELAPVLFQRRMEHGV